MADVSGAEVIISRGRTVTQAYEKDDETTTKLLALGQMF